MTSTSVRSSTRLLTIQPAAVTVRRQPAQASYHATAPGSAASSRYRDWLIITPGHALHPTHDPHHWLAAPLEGDHGNGSALPGTLTFLVSTAGLAPGTSHETLVYIALRLNDDEAELARLTV